MSSESTGTLLYKYRRRHSNYCPWELTVVMDVANKDQVKWCSNSVRCVPGCRTDRRGLWPRTQIKNKRKEQNKKKHEKHTDAHTSTPVEMGTFLTLDCYVMDRQCLIFNTPCLFFSFFFPSYTQTAKQHTLQLFSNGWTRSASEVGTWIYKYEFQLTSGRNQHLDSV